MGHSVGYIPWSAIRDWAIFQGVTDPDEFEVLRYVVQKMDTFWVEFFQAKHKMAITKPAPMKPPMKQFPKGQING